MIQRYTRDKMGQIWSPESKFQKWLEMELAACKAHHQLGAIPDSDYKTICEKARFDVKRIDEIEADIHHDVIAFLTSVAEFVGPSSRFIHLGLTSSDVVDTAFSLQIRDAGNLLLDGLDALMNSIKTQAMTHKLTLQMGRTHGVHAEPLTFGLKLTVWYAEMQRNRTRLVEAIAVSSTGLVSGAVGNYAHMSPELEILVCAELKLTPSPASTQTLQRDRHAQFMTTLAIIAGTLEKMATEIRALQKTEFNEVLEPFSSTQKGSSAMPHKRNPIVCERVTGLARLIRGYAVGALENQALWHERDISHSSIERVIFPDATIALDYMLSLMTKVISGMTVNANAMKENIDKSFHIFFSQQLLLKLIETGITREDAYRWVQENALAAFDTKTNFQDKIRQDERITSRLTSDEIGAIFSLDKYTQHVETIYQRIFT